MKALMLQLSNFTNAVAEGEIPEINADATRTTALNSIKFFTILPPPSYINRKKDVAGIQVPGKGPPAQAGPPSDPFFPNNLS